MARGPKKTSTKILTIRGSWRAKDRPTEQTGSYKRPEMPKYLTGDARTEWLRVLPILESMGVLAEGDGIMLGLYCDAYADFKEARNTLKKEGKIHSSPNGYMYQHPAVAMKDRAWEKIKKVCVEFGLSPSSRTGLAALPKSRDTKGKSRFFEKNKSS